ncbi:hypothetical protein [Cellulomonas edaphi]|uniref:Uncharacterized protein n=1 Tax=Cellulomonas edaphi TaxID=3053468 RepID=A0ABT7S2K7_9CELL|nr:hypothetical protein [Cellulomons edaphi]MDM7829841.1 hypothetical protein [Cellulomons edaphi]
MALPTPLPAPRAGFVLYVAVPDSTSVTALADVAASLHELAVDALPGAETVTALSLVPGGSDDVRRIGDRLTELRLLPADH